jgi:glycosyltransferase involved in cell wall biosynthesis
VNPVKILQISTLDRAGGAERIAFNLMDALNSDGHDVRMAVGEKRGSSPLVYEIPNRAVRSWPAGLAYRLPPWMRRRGIGGSHMLQRALLRFCEPARARRLANGHEDFDHPATALIPGIAGFDPEILHAHNLHGGYFDLRGLPGLSQARPFTITLHDAWLFSGHCAHSFECEGWVSGCGACPHLDTPPDIPVDRTRENWSLKKEIYAASALYIVAVSDFLLRKLQRSMLTPRMSRVIHNGVDRAVFRPPADRAALRRKLGIPEDARVAVFAAAGVKRNPWKDYACLNASMEGIAAAYDGSGKLILLCMGEAAERQDHSRWEKRFTGYLSRPEDVAEYYQAADIYLHPARIDSFPNVILEAMACGVPTVATAVGGIPEQIRDGQNGFLVPLGDFRAMTGRALRILGDESCRAALGSYGLERVSREFTLESQVAAYLDWYRAIREDFRSRFPPA